jgi:quercetin dioxygenase-like cupin family protein
MAVEGQELEGPDGYRLRFVRIEPDVLEMEARYAAAGALPPAHLHPRQTERFDVLGGAVLAVIDGAERRYGAGESFEVPAGTVHQMTGDGPARLNWQVRPALNTAGFFEELYTGAAQANPGEFLVRYADEFQLALPPGGDSAEGS